MFIYYSLTSINELLQPGQYECALHVMSSADRAISALLYRYTRAGECLPCSVDLVVRDSTGSIYIRDFLLLSDGMWRDSDGNIDESISALLPAELADLPWIDASETSKIEVQA